MQYPVCHLTDVNLDTAFFGSLASCCDRDRYPVMLGSIGPAGTLQEAMRLRDTPAFSLGVRSRLQYALAVWRLVRLIKRERVAILHAHCFDPTFIGLIAARLAGVPFVFTRHHSDHNIRLGKRWHTSVDSWCARHADHVIAVSEITRQIMIGEEEVPAHQITVVYNGLEPLREPDPKSVERVRQELGLLDERVCLIVGRLHEEKGHRFLFDAVPEISRRVGPVVFLLAGEGPHRAAIEADSRQRGLEKAVRFLGRRDDVPELLSLASVLALPSLAESFGFALLEAMSLGKPVVASTVGGIPEVVTDGETGLLVPPTDSRALADAICRVLEDNELARGLGDRGRLRSASFSFKRMMHGYEAVYDRVLRTSQVTQRANVETV